MIFLNKNKGDIKNMSRFPKDLTHTNVDFNVMNAIRNDASVNYKTYVPVATNGSENLRTIGAILFDNPALLNEFQSALVNRIFVAYVSSRLYRNPLSVLKKGMIDFGETIEDIFVAMAKPYQYEGNPDSSKIFDTYKSDVRSAFYVMNSMLYYPVTINRPLLKSAFKSYEALGEYMSGLVTSVYTAMYYDEQQIMQYLFAYHLLKGNIKCIATDYTGDDKKLSAESTLVAVRENASEFTFMNSAYTIAGVHNYTEPNDLIIMLGSNVRANTDVRGLAAAFNLEYANFANRTITMPRFKNLDIARLNKIFENNDTYVEFSEDELELLDTNVSMIMFDERFTQFYDNLVEVSDMQNPVSLSQNTFLHHWSTYAVSPFVNVAYIGQPLTTDNITPSDILIIADRGFNENNNIPLQINIGKDTLLANIGDTINILPYFKGAYPKALKDVTFTPIEFPAWKLDEKGVFTVLKTNLEQDDYTAQSITLNYTDSDGTRKNVTRKIQITSYTSYATI